MQRRQQIFGLLFLLLCPRDSLAAPRDTNGFVAEFPCTPSDGEVVLGYISGEGKNAHSDDGDGMVTGCEEDVMYYVGCRGGSEPQLRFSQKPAKARRKAQTNGSSETRYTFDTRRPLNVRVYCGEPVS